MLIPPEVRFVDESRRPFYALVDQWQDGQIGLFQLMARLEAVDAELKHKGVTIRPTT